MAAVTVRLYRDSLQTPWGFRVQGGADFHTPLTVQRVFTGSPAEGELHRGDTVVGIDNYDATTMLHSEAQDVIKNSGGTLLLNIRRPHGAVPPSQSSRAMAAVSAAPPHSRVPSQPTWRPSGPRPEFGVQYGGSPRGRAVQQPVMAPQHQQHQQQADNYMMDRVSRSLATMDLQAAAQRSMDDQDVDYAFTQQSVADRRKAFMQPTSYGNTYHSVPRPNSSGSAAANRYRQKRQPDPVLGQRVPEFGWTPSPDLLRQARRGPSSAAFEQQSYLPSQGQGVREDSPFRAGRSHGGRGAHGDHGGFGGHGGGPGGHVGHGGHGGGHGGHGGGGRQRSSAMLRLNSTGGGAEDPPAEVPVAFNNKQYNTPINMYSKQNVATAFEGQTGIALGPGQQAQEPAYMQSQVYKLVHEQDNQRQRQRHQNHHQPQPQPKSAPAWLINSEKSFLRYSILEFLAIGFATEFALSPAVRFSQLAAIRLISRFPIFAIPSSGSPLELDDASRLSISRT
uniref:PDZ domain-containing protein n=1 Tax=Macrostomum lignano TaxID=282301 RepID=A0A1I8JD03_9PLAT